jgi:hypothetical protein
LVHCVSLDEKLGLRNLSIKFLRQFVTPDKVLRVATILSTGDLDKLLKLLKFNGDGWGTRIRT